MVFEFDSDVVTAGPVGGIFVFDGEGSEQAPGGGGQNNATGTAPMLVNVGTLMNS